MKRSLLTMLATLFFLTGGSLAQQNTNLGFVDSTRVLQGTDEGQAGLEQLNSYMAQKRQELDAKASELQSMQDEFTRTQRTLNADARAEMESTIQQKQLELKRFQEDAQADVEQRQTALLSRMSEKVQAIIDNFAQANNYAVIFMWDPQTQVYVDPSLDVTDEIIRIYNETHPMQQESTASTSPEPATVEEP